jgi:peptidoglycan/xylan/chitin deacetylase (PgdA/CDA1 family)
VSSAPRRVRAMLCLALLSFLLTLAACGAAPIVNTPIVVPAPARATATPPPTAAPPAPTVPAGPTATVPAPPTATDSPATATASPVAMTTPPRVPVLAYHHFGVPAAGDYDCPLDTFEKQLRWLKKHDYQSILPQQLVDAMHGKATLPPHPVMLTFDDNNAEQYLDAAPLLEKYGYRGAFFIMTVTIGKRYYMKADQLQDLEKRGHTLGGHTWDHRNIALLTMPEFERQLDLSEADFVEAVGHKPTFMSYPFGPYTPDDVTELQSRGYHGGFRLRDADDPPVDPAFMIPRQIIPGAWTMDEFAASVHSMEP